MTSKEHTQTVKNVKVDRESPGTIYRVQRYDHYTIYTKNGEKHRVNGPAMTIGDKEWFYIDGLLKTPKEHKLYKELYNNYANDPTYYTSTTGDITQEELYYQMASESPTSIYTTTTTSTSIFKLDDEVLVEF